MCSSQTVAYGVDVFALAGAQDTAVSLQIPAFSIGTASDFDISFPNAVRTPCLRAQECSMGVTYRDAVHEPREHALATHEALKNGGHEVLHN